MEAVRRLDAGIAHARSSSLSGAQSVKLPSVCRAGLRGTLSVLQPSKR